MYRRRGAPLALTAVLCMLVAINVAGAVPSLQLYSPDAVYNDEWESWVIYEEPPFELQVAGALSPDSVHHIEDVRLWMSLPQEYQGNQYEGADVAGGVDVTIEEPDGSGGWNHLYSLSTGAGSDLPLLDGRPTFGGKKVPPHDIYPTDYWEVRPLPDLQVAAGTDTVYDYNSHFDPEDPGDGTQGDIQHYRISYAPFVPEVLIHIDLGGHLVDADGNSVPSESTSYRFAPFSHDADAMVPEPSTLALLGLLLCGSALTLALRGRKAPGA